jgi:glycerol-3-phosphate dehydrogenase (NAD(P)+)
MSRIAILGSGAWGTALALTLARKGGHDVSLWSHGAHISKIILESAENTAYLPGFALPSTIRSTGDLSVAVKGAEIVVSTMPSEHVRAVYEHLAEFVTPNQALVSATKGLEDGTHLRMSQVIESVLSSYAGARRVIEEPKEPAGPVLAFPAAPTVVTEAPAAEVDQSSPWKIAALSGPTFAYEVAAGQPTAMTVASTDAELAERIQQDFSTPRLRVYTNEDLVGVELGGAVKNVIAIATGIAAGLELGHNAMAALITRGIAEVTRLAVACGGRRETLAGLSGIGDLVLTCTGSLSRNRTVGIALGQGRKLEEILKSLGGKVAEGVRTTPAALGLARLHGVEMPITEQMDAILRTGKHPRDAMRDLMGRPGRDE